MRPIQRVVCIDPLQIYCYQMIAVSFRQSDIHASPALAGEAFSFTEEWPWDVWKLGLRA